MKSLLDSAQAAKPFLNMYSSLENKAARIMEKIESKKMKAFMASFDTKYSEKKIRHK